MRVAVVGGGAAGVAAALALSEFGARVVLFEANDRLGGMADSMPHPVTGVHINYGVQGIHTSFAHTRAMLRVASQRDTRIPGLRPTRLTSKFVTPQRTWSTSQFVVTADYVRNIRRFRSMCREAQQYPDVFAMFTVVQACASYFVSDSFVRDVVCPVLALFFGTGNRVADVPAVLAAQVFNVGLAAGAVTLFDLDDSTFISMQKDNMLALPPLRLVYQALHAELRARGVDVRLGARIHAIDRNGRVNGEPFDRVIVAAQAHDAAKLLRGLPDAARVLGNFRYHTDVTVTHQDRRHMQATFDYDGRSNYYIRERSLADMDMGFDLTLYQMPPHHPDVFQTIFLEPVSAERVAALDGASLFAPHVWTQVSHTLHHFWKCVLHIKRIQGPIVYFAGSYQLVNSHEVAVMSGIRAAQLALATTVFPEKTFGKSGAGFRQFVSQVN